MPRPSLPQYETHPNVQSLGDMLSTFEDAGGNLSYAHNEYYALQQPHSIASKSAITHAAENAARMAVERNDSTALILGAGACSDIPVKHLAEIFDQTTIIEMDVDASRLAVSRLPHRLQTKVKIVQADMTGFLEPMTLAVSEATKQPQWAGFVTEFADRLNAIDATQTLPDFGDDRAFVCSHLVASQLANTPVTYADQVSQDTYHQNLGHSSDNLDVLSAQLLIQQFSTRAQLAHLDLLRRTVANTGIVHFADTMFQVEDDTATPLVTTRIKDEIATRFDTIGQWHSWQWQATPQHTYAVSQIALMAKQ